MNRREAIKLLGAGAALAAVPAGGVAERYTWEPVPDGLGGTGVIVRDMLGAEVGRGFIDVSGETILIRWERKVAITSF